MPYADNIRVWSAVSPEVDEKLNKWAKKLGLTKSQFINICIQAGIGQVIRSLAPEEAFSPDQWANMFQAMVKLGQPVKLPDGTIIGAEE